MSLILRGFSALLQRSIAIGARASTLIPNGIYAAINAIWEAMLGAPAPGAGLPYMVPHDHSDYAGGAAIPRGCIYSFDTGDEASFEAVFATTTSWTPFVSRDYTFPAFVSPGIDTDSDSIVGGGAKCYLQAKVLCVGTATGGQLRLTNKNRTTTTTSATATVGTSLAWVDIDNVPCIGGQWNEFDLDVQQSTATANTVTVYAFSLHELRDPSQPESSGAYTYSSVPRPS